MRKTDINKIKNALVETFGHDGLEEAFEKCQSSPRFCVLMAIASRDGSESWEWLIRSAKKIANNPKTRAILN